MWKNILPAVLLSGAVLISGCGKKDSGATGVPEAKQIRIGVSIPAADHGWTGGIVWNAQESKKKWEAAGKNVKVLVSTARDAAEQVDRIENLLAQNVDALVVLPQEPEPLTAVCAQAKKAGKYLVVVDRGLADPNAQDVLVAGDNPGFGRESAEVLAKALSGKGQILVMEGIPCAVNTDRVEAFREVLKKYPEIRILESQSAYWDTEKGLKLMENFLQKYPKIDAVWTGDDDVLIGALKAVSESNRKDIQLMLGGGGSKVIVGKILAGDPLVRMTVTYPPKMIAVGIDEAVSLVKKTSSGQKKIVVPAEVIDSANAKANYFPDSIY